MATPLKRQSTVRSPPRDNEELIQDDGGPPVDFQTGRLTRSIEIPFYEEQRRNLQFNPTWLGSLFTKKHGIRIYDIGIYMYLFCLTYSFKKIENNLVQLHFCKKKKKKN